MANSIIMGVKGVDNIPDDSHGLTINNCSYVNISNTLLRSVNGYAVNIFSSDNLLISNTEILDCKIGVFGYQPQSSLINGIIINGCTTPIQSDSGLTIINKIIDGVYSDT